MAYTFQALLISLDGEDHVTDFSGCKTKQEVWDNIENMGSRWYFYPLCFVQSETNNKVVDVPPYPCLNECVGMTVEQTKQHVQANSGFVTSLVTGT